MYTRQNTLIGYCTKGKSEMPVYTRTNTKRFIDDMFSFGTEPPGSEWYAGLEHKETTKATCVVFSGAKIEWKLDVYLDFWVFDKFDEWNFSVIKFSPC